MFLYMGNEWIIDFLLYVIVKLVTIEEDLKLYNSYYYRHL